MPPDSRTVIFLSIDTLAILFKLLTATMILPSLSSIIPSAPLRFLQSGPTGFPAIRPYYRIRIIDALSVLDTNRLVSFLSKAMSFAPISRGNLAGGQNLRSPFRRGSLSHFATLPFGCTVNKN